MSAPVAFGVQALRLDAELETRRIVDTLRRQLLKDLRRRGVVVGLSGGVDSSVVAALCVRAFGPQKVLGLFMPEQDSDPESLRLGRVVADVLGIATELEDITPILAAAGCYRRRDECIRRMFPDYGPGYRSKIAVRKAHADGYNVSHLIVEAPDGERREARMPIDVYLGIVAATSMKQRTRKQLEYYHADRLNFAVAGTPNRLEYDQGFFVKNGDGAADVKPIAHLYKSQVYQLAEHLGVPEEIRSRPPTTDTYSLAQTQEEFYFGIPLQKLDLCLYALDHGIDPAEASGALGLEPAQVESVFRDILGKRQSTRYQHEPPMLVEAA
jgi:NAD+ synthase